VLRAVVLTPRAPAVFVICQGPSRQPSADVVVVAGAGGTEPLGVGALLGVGVELVPGDSPPELGEASGPVGDSVLAGELVIGAAESAGAGARLPESPHTAPAMRPTIAASATAMPTTAPTGMAPAVAGVFGRVTWPA
jgi:hypothetical protein